jgi:phosphoribosylformylglycinamidine synthase PurS subunit
MKADISISPKEGILDPQGLAVLKALQNLGFAEVKEVRVGKFIKIELDNCDNPSGRIKRMCEELLHNPLIESYRFELKED